MQKLFNTMAVIAFGFTVAQLVVLGHIFSNQDKYLEQVKETVIQEVKEMVPDLIQSSLPSAPSGLDTGSLNVGPNF